MIICLVRHGETDWNKKGIVQGHSDIKLNETGITQAKNVGAYLKKHDPNWDVIIASPLSRAIDTARIIANELNFQDEIIINPEVKERFFGEFEGAIINQDTMNLVFHEKVKDMELHLPLQKRAINALRRIGTDYKDKKVLVITHSHFIKSAIVPLDQNFNYRSYLKNTTLNYFEYDHNQLKVLSYNINTQE